MAPVAVGETLIVVHRDFAEMERLGFIPKRPLMAAAQAARQRDHESAPSGPIADAELGLSKESVFDASTSAAVKVSESWPGEGPLSLAFSAAASPGPRQDS